MHKRLDELEILPDPTTYHRVSCPEASEKLIFPFFLALYSGSQVSIVALWATCLEPWDFIHCEHYQIIIMLPSLIFMNKLLLISVDE